MRFKIQNWVGVAASLVVCGAANAGVVDDFNAGQTQAPNTKWSPITDIGWYYTPSISYTLNQVQTIFTQSTDPGDVNRDVTIAIFTDRPANGGTLLGSGTFNTSTARGTYGGATFAGINLTGGTTYFVGLENILNLGVNEVTYLPDSNGPAGSVAPGSTWQDTSGAAFGTQGSNGTTWFDKPVIRFSTTVPEPMSLGLLLGAVTLLRRRTR